MSAIRRIRRVDRVGLQQRMALPVVGEQDAPQIRDGRRTGCRTCRRPRAPSSSRRDRRPRASGHGRRPAPSRVFIRTEKRASRLSTHATTSRPSSFQSTAVRERKRSRSRASPSQTSPNATHCAGGTTTVIAVSSPLTMAPGNVARRARRSGRRPLNPPSGWARRACRCDGSARSAPEAAAARSAATPAVVDTRARRRPPESCDPRL